MKNIILFILLGILTTIGLAGCGADRGNRGKDLQGLSQIEVDLICNDFKIRYAIGDGL